MDNPRRIFGLPEQPETWVEVDESATYELHAADMHSRCGWTPFEGWPLDFQAHYQPGPGVPPASKDPDANIKHHISGTG